MIISVRNAGIIKDYYFNKVDNKSHSMTPPYIPGAKKS
jgi:hypothetical protein